MKKFISSKGFLCSVLVAACIGILVTCLLVNMEHKNDFQPEEPAANDTRETTAAANAGNRTDTDTPAPAATQDPMEEYPKVVEESGDGVVIDFTPESEELS